MDSQIIPNLNAINNILIVDSKPCAVLFNATNNKLWNELKEMCMPKHVGPIFNYVQSKFVIICFSHLF